MSAKNESQKTRKSADVKSDRNIVTKVDAVHLVHMI